MSLPPHPSVPTGPAVPPSPPSADTTTADGSRSARPRAMGVEAAVRSQSPGGKSGEDSTARGRGGNSEAKPKPIWKKCWDYKQAATYYKNTITKESRWASAEDPEWMEATDPASGQVFLEHVTSGESRWKADDNQTAVRKEACGAAGPAGHDGGAGVNESRGAATSGQETVWEELTQPGTGLCYYYSSASRSSQWHPPLWMDYFDKQENSVYYFNTVTKETSWERPAEFVSAATENQPSQRDSHANIPGKVAAGESRTRSPSLPRPPPNSRVSSTSTASTAGPAAGQRASSPPSSGAHVRPPAALTGRPKRPASPPPRNPASPIGVGKNKDTKRPKPPAFPASPTTRSTPGDAHKPPPPPSHVPGDGKTTTTTTTAVPPSPPAVTNGGAASVSGLATEGSATRPTTQVPPPPPKPRDGSSVGRWSPRGSVPPPPGPPPAANLPPAAEAMAVDSNEDNDDDDDLDLDAEVATG